MFFQESLYSMCCPKNNNTLILQETYLPKQKVTQETKIELLKFHML